ncbi:MAG: hypothetical protein HEQ39_07925 [Rhizobacter sp.]
MLAIESLSKGYGFRGQGHCCAKETASALAIAPANVPIEGYYAEDEQLTEYFRLMRALQRVPRHLEPNVFAVEGYKRLKQIIESGIFGPSSDGDCLLSGGEDSLSLALQKTIPAWNIPKITDAAYLCAVNSNDFSLVTLAALSRDPVVLTALRESVVLYAAAVAGSAMNGTPEYIWTVDQVVESRARQFVDTFNRLFNESLPLPDATNAATFWRGCNEWKVVGRCVRIGFSGPEQPVKNYHWAIDFDANHALIVKDFWDIDIWTTQRYSEQMESR